MEKDSRLFTPVLLIGCSIVLVGFAIRASFGVFQIPIQEEFSWPRSEFSLAIAIQNLAWGFGAPFFGAFAEKIGDKNTSRDEMLENLIKALKKNGWTLKK